MEQLWRSKRTRSRLSCTDSGKRECSVQVKFTAHSLLLLIIVDQGTARLSGSRSGNPASWPHQINRRIASIVTGCSLQGYVNGGICFSVTRHENRETKMRDRPHPQVICPFISELDRVWLSRLACFHRSLRYRPFNPTALCFNDIPESILCYLRSDLGIWIHGNRVRPESST